MPYYEYQGPDGQIICRYRPLAQYLDDIIEDGILYKRIISAPNIIMDSKKPKTIKDQGIKNYEKAKKEGTLPKSMKQKKSDPWWRKGKKRDKDLMKMTPTQKTRYIKTGKK